MGRARLSLQIAIVVLFFASLVWAWRQLSRPDILPIKTIKIVATYDHVSRQALGRAVAPFVQGGFWSLDVAGLRASVLAIPWVGAVAVSRIWPDTVSVTVQEQQAFARWGDTHVMNEKGDIFPSSRHNMPKALPQLTAPDKDAVYVQDNYKKMKKILSTVGLHITSLTFSESGAWSLGLGNGMTIMLGQHQPLERLERFVKTYQHIFGSRGTAAKRIDLRYPNGMAVHWDISARQFNARGQQHV